MLRLRFIKIILILTIIINFPSLKAEEKKNIIQSIDRIENVEFNFIQISNNIEETGVCFLKRPYYFKCKYEDKNKKEIIVNKDKLVIYHKRYQKIYNYPLSKSYFSELLNKKELIELISNGNIEKKDDLFLIKSLIEGKGEITFYFNKENYNLAGWDLINLSNNKIIFKILKIRNNPELSKRFFDIPTVN